MLNTVTDIPLRRPRREAAILKALVDNAATANELWENPEIRSGFRGRKQFFATVEELKESGVLVICNYNGNGASVWASPVETVVPVLPGQEFPTTNSNLVQLQRRLP